MIEELDILKIVAENPSISQRKIAEKTGISLGQVNFLIKKFVAKGLIKIEGQTTKSLKYNLTPKGIAEKASLTLEYIKISYEAVSALSIKIETLCKKYHGNGMKIFICGSNDEMMQIARIVLNSCHISWTKWAQDGDISAIDNYDSNYIVFCWDTKIEEELKKNQISVANILK